MQECHSNCRNLYPDYNTGRFGYRGNHSSVWIVPIEKVFNTSLFSRKAKSSESEMHQSVSRELGPNPDGFYILAEKEREADEDIARTQFQ